MNFVGEHVARLIDDCSKMLEYATDRGIDIKPPAAENIAAAREAFVHGNWTPQHEGELYAAKIAIAAAIKPVTPQTLASNADHEAKEMLRFYHRLTLALVIIIVPLSMVVFMDSDLSAKGKHLINENDKIGLAIHNGLQSLEREIEASASTVASAPTAAPPSRRASSSTAATSPVPASSTAASSPNAASAAEAAWAHAVLEWSQKPNVLQLKENLQEFARNTRQLYAETMWLTSLTLNGSDNVYASPWMLTGPLQRENLELTLPILGKRGDGMSKLAVYQDIRAMAQNTQRTSDILWGAITSFLLPLFYAILGTLAFILRELTDQSVKKTFDPAYVRFANRARLITAVIVGTVIGLFGSLFETPVAAVSPLAIAFLAGYAADSFFSFLDRAVVPHEKVASK
jgi:hypothetical protein